MYEKFEGGDFQEVHGFVAKKEETQVSGRKSRIRDLLPVETSVKDLGSVHIINEDVSSSDNNSKKIARLSKTNNELAPFAKSLTF